MVASKYIDRFWLYVNKKEPDECWLWLGYRERSGYGRPNINGKNILAHRFAYELENGLGSAKDRIIRHSCDNRACCNPKHLIAGTQKENVADMYAKGRQPDWKGSNHPSARLTENDIKSVKELIDCGLTNNNVAEQFGVSSSMVSLIKRGHRWKHMDVVVKNMQPFRSKLTEKDISEIKELISKGMVQRRIAEKYNVDPATICYIKRGKTWKHVTD